MHATGLPHLQRHSRPCACAVAWCDSCRLVSGNSMRGNPCRAARAQGAGMRAAAAPSRCHPSAALTSESAARGTHAMGRMPPPVHDALLSSCGCQLTQQQGSCFCPALLPQLLLLLLLTPGLCDSNSVYADAACIPPRCPAQHPLHQLPCATRIRRPSLPSLTAWRARGEQQKRQIQQPQRTRPASRRKQRPHRGSSSSGSGGRGGDGNGDAGVARKAGAGRYCLRCRSCEIMGDSWVSLQVGRMKRPRGHRRGHGPWACVYKEHLRSNATQNKPNASSHMYSWCLP